MKGATLGQSECQSLMQIQSKRKANVTQTLKRSQRFTGSTYTVTVDGLLVKLPIGVPLVASGQPRHPRWATTGYLSPPFDVPAKGLFVGFCVCVYIHIFICTRMYKSTYMNYNHYSVCIVCLTKTGQILASQWSVFLCFILN